MHTLTGGRSCFSYCTVRHRHQTVHVHLDRRLTENFDSGDFSMAYAAGETAIVLL